MRYERRKLVFSKSDEKELRNIIVKKIDKVSDDCREEDVYVALHKLIDSILFEYCIENNLPRDE